jgi:hypothetical protein
MDTSIPDAAGQKCQADLKILSQPLSHSKKAVLPKVNEK